MQGILRITLVVATLFLPLSLSAQSKNSEVALDILGGLTPTRGERVSIGRVVSLADSGAGSLRECINGATPRVCIFEVGGVINLTSDLVLDKNRVTISGQTAPTPGVILRGATLSIEASDIVVEHLSVWVGDSLKGPRPAYRDGVRIGSEKRLVSRVVVDHLSVLWGIDENVSIFGGARDITIQNTLIAEGLDKSIHPKGAHSKGILLSPNSKRISLIRNVIAFHGERLPLIQGGSSVLMLNNVIYGWGGTSRSSIVDISDNKGSSGVLLDLIGNVFIQAPWSTAFPSVFGKPVSQLSRIFLHDNLGPSRSNSSIPEKEILDPALAATISNFPTTYTGSESLIRSSEVESAVITQVGSRPTSRSAPDRRIIKSLQSRTGEVKDCIINCMRKVGGWPNVRARVRPRSRIVNFAFKDPMNFKRALRRYLSTSRLRVLGEGKYKK